MIRHITNQNNTFQPMVPPESYCGTLEDMIRQSVPHDRKRPAFHRDLQLGDRIIFKDDSSERIQSGVVLKHNPETKSLKIYSVANRRKDHDFVIHLDLRKVFWIYRNAEMFICPFDKLLEDCVSPPLGSFPRNTLANAHSIPSFNYYYSGFNGPTELYIYSSTIRGVNQPKFYQRYIFLESGMFIQTEEKRYVIIGIKLKQMRSPIYFVTDLKTEFRFLYGAFAFNRFMCFPQDSLLHDASFVCIDPYAVTSLFEQDGFADTLAVTTKQIMHELLPNAVGFDHIIDNGIRNDAAIFPNEIEEVWSPRPCKLEGIMSSLWLENEDCIRIYKRGELDLELYN